MKVPMQPASILTHQHPRQPPYQPPVFRQLAIPVPVFDYIKQYQRDHQATRGEHLTIVQVISAMVLGHQSNRQNEKSSEVRNNEQSTKSNSISHRA